TVTEISTVSKSGVKEWACAASSSAWPYEPPWPLIRALTPLPSPTAGSTDAGMAWTSAAAAGRAGASPAPAEVSLAPTAPASAPALLAGSRPFPAPVRPAATASPAGRGAAQGLRAPGHGAGHRARLGQLDDPHVRGPERLGHALGGQLQDRPDVGRGQRVGRQLGDRRLLQGEALQGLARQGLLPHVD